MLEEIRPPRESIVDLALLLERSLSHDDDWYSGDQVMDLHHLKRRLAEQEEQLDRTIGKVRLQGAALSMTSLQKIELRRDAVALIGVCMNILQATGLLDPDLDI
ncbi:MAG: hypothetical protein ISF22_07215 [Methanomassiliicoccus sp.]|nr:hypothetical protein [Methanomassiliicoccus sp.]